MSFPLPPGRSQAAADKLLMQGLICIVLLCMAAQIITTPAQRALGRTHLHLNEPGALKAVAPHGHNHEQGHEQRHEQGHGQGHGHAALFRHRHDASERSVVYLAEDDHRNNSGQGPTPRPAAHDLDGLMPQPQPKDADQTPRRWRAALPPHFRSHITAPPLRPPQG